MISFDVGRWIGLDEMGEEELTRLLVPSMLAVERAAQHFANAVKKTLTGPRHGRIYRVRGRLHQASAPGEPPAVLRGELRQSITVGEVIHEGWDISCEVGSALDKALRLEVGGVDSRGVRILPRPYFEPTYIQEEDALIAILETAVK